jgi:hypothetical protein
VDAKDADVSDDIKQLDNFVNNDHAREIADKVRAARQRAEEAIPKWMVQD